MKTNRQQIEAALQNCPDHIRFFLLHGPDMAGSRALLTHLATAAGEGAERVQLSGGEIKADPARLVDEAASFSLFGGKRYIIIEAVGDEVANAAEDLLSAPAAGNPVVMVTGALKPTSRLLKLALASENVLAFASYVPEGIQAHRLVSDMGRGLGLIIGPNVACLIAESTGGDRSLIAQELDKFALYLDATPQQPRELDQEIVEHLGAASDEGDSARLVDYVAGGDLTGAESELVRLSAQGIEGISLLRAILRRMMLLARLRAEVEQGSSVSAVMATQGKSIFWKEKDAVAAQLSRWRSDLIAKAISRLVEAERQVKASGGLGTIVADAELLTICRQAVRLR